MMRLLLLCCLLSPAIPGASFARTWYVNPYGTGDAPTIQAAVDSAVSGDDIVLAAGVFVGVGNRSILIDGKDIEITSGGGPYACVIDCQLLGNGFNLNRCTSSLQGLTIRNGRGSRGGGVSLYDATVSASDCIFELDSTAVFLGGRGTFVNCIFANNSGSAVYAGMSTLNFTGCKFLDNTTENYGGGGAVYLETWSDATFTDCTFRGNDAGPYLDGSAIGFTRSEITLRNCTLYGNHDWSVIDAVCWWGDNEFHSLTLVNTIIAYNAGWAVIWESWDGSDCGDFSANVSCCNIFGNRANWADCISGFKNINGNFSACPSFCAADLGDLHLCDSSPCLPGNHPTGYDCGLIGAWDEGCACGPSKIQPSTWGAIKAIYK